MSDRLVNSIAGRPGPNRADVPGLARSLPDLPRPAQAERHRREVRTRRRLSVLSGDPSWG